METAKIMRVSKFISGLFVALFVAQAAFGQAEKLGIVQYTAPKGWTKTPKENVVAFSQLNETTGAFCILTVYGATPGTGNAQNDFKRDWNRLVVETLQAETDPKTETESADGWTAITGGAAVEFQGGKALAFLTVFSGFAKTVSVLAVFNDQSYLPQVEAFISGIDIDQTAPAVPSPAVQPNQPGKFGTMMYTTPAGWNEQKFQDGVVFKPSDLPQGEHLAIQIMEPLNASGSLEQALRQSYEEAATMYKLTMMNEAGGGNYKQNEARRSFNGWEYIRGNGGVQAENGTPYKTELGLEVFVVKMNNRFERVAILQSRTNCNLSRYYASDRLVYRNDIETFLFSLRFTDFKAESLETGSAKGSGIVGVWQGISLSTGAPSVGEPLGVRYKVFSPIFLSNGQAYFGPKFPTQGLNAFDTRIAPELHRRDWGTYTFANGKGVLKMPYGDIPLRMENNALIITANKTDHKFIKLNAVDGARFQGTYALSEVEGKIPSITFTSDGRFTDNGAIKVLYHEYIDCLNPALKEGSGTYEVKDHSVVFRYSDGRRIAIAFLGVDYSASNPSPATLTMSFNEDKLIRQ